MPQSREDRFRALYETQQRRVTAYALRRTSSAEDAADVVAETFTIAWRRLDDIPSGGSQLPWLYVTARHVMANQTRGAVRDSGAVERLTHELKRAVEDAPDEEGLIASIALAALPEADREILMLSAWEGLGSKGLGSVLGCSPVAARIRLHRARRRLLEEIAEFDAAEEPRRPAPQRRLDAPLSIARGEVCQ
jgi:RNA polymerase sigma-70 factor, ECF subfamily